jgi:deazaflavin-dependent oxidoreductase (nitroreductase family)
MRFLDHVLAWCSGHIPLLTARTHRLLYRLSRGRLGGKVPGYQILWLTTSGRHTGRLFTWPLIFFMDGDDMIILASNNGADVHPNWYLNLRKNPLVTVEANGVRRVMTGTTVEGEERSRLWEVAMRSFPLYKVVTARTQRRIPVVRLHSASVEGRLPEAENESVRSAS